MSDDTTAQALAVVIERATICAAPIAAARAVLDSGLVVSQDMYEIASAFGATAARERDYERARVDRLTRALAEANATIARVEAECAKWERRAPDGYPIEPWAIDLAKRLRRALDGGGG